MTDFKHIEEQIAWLQLEAETPNYMPAAERLRYSSAAATMQSLLDENRDMKFMESEYRKTLGQALDENKLFEDVAKAAEGAWQPSLTVEIRDALAKLKE